MVAGCISMVADGCRRQKAYRLYAIAYSIQFSVVLAKISTKIDAKFLMI